MKETSIIVLGGGLMGSAAAWQLASAGASVVLLERQSISYQHGSSLGEARITRSLGPKGDIFSYLQRLSIAETQRLIAFLNKKDTEKHAIEEIHTTSPVTYIFHKNQSEDVQAYTEDRSQPFEIAYGTQEAKDKFGMQVSDDKIVIREFKKHSGTMNPTVLIQKLHKAIVLAGGKVLYEQEVTSLRRIDNGYELNVNTREGTNIIQCEKVVSALGPNTFKLLNSFAPKYPKPETRRSNLSFFRIEGINSEDLNEKIKTFFPVALFNDEIFYAMVERFENGSPLLKVGGHFRRADATIPDEIWGLPVPDEDIAWAREQLTAYLNCTGVDMKPENLKFEKGYSCVYTLTESEVPLVTNIHKNNGEMDSNFVVITGLSGVGAKGALAYGKIAAGLLTNTSQDDEMYRKTMDALGNKRLS